MKKTKQITFSKAKKRAWNAFSKFVRTRDAIKTTGEPDRVKCCSCGRVMEAYGSGMCHAGHFIAGRRAANLFDERGCHAQCYVCNVRLKGNWTNYYRFMQNEYGDDVIEQLMEQDKTEKKYFVHELLDLEKSFEEKTSNLLREWSERQAHKI